MNVCTHNTFMYDQVSEQLFDVGIPRHSKWCHKKKKGVKGLYNKAQDNNSLSSSEWKTSPFYHELHQTFGTHLSTQPVEHLGSLAVPRRAL